MDLSIQLGLFRVDSISAFTSVIFEDELVFEPFKESLDEDIYTPSKRYKNGNKDEKKNNSQKNKKKIEIYQSNLFKVIDSLLSDSILESISDPQKELSNIGSWVLVSKLFELFIRSASMIHASIFNKPLDLNKEHVESTIPFAQLTGVTSAASVAVSETLGDSALNNLVYLFFKKIFSQINGIMLNDLNNFLINSTPIHKTRFNTMTMLLSTYVENAYFGLTNEKTLLTSDSVFRKQYTVVDYWMSNIVCPFVKFFCFLPYENQKNIYEKSISYATLSDGIAAFKIGLQSNPDSVTIINPETMENKNLSSIVLSAQFVFRSSRMDMIKLFEKLLTVFSQSRQLDIFFSNIINNLWDENLFSSKALDFSEEELKEYNLISQNWFALNVTKKVSENMPPPLIPSLISEFSENIDREITNMKSNDSDENLHSKRKSSKSNGPNKISHSLRLRAEGLILIFFHFLKGASLSSTTKIQDSKLFDSFVKSVDNTSSKIEDVINNSPNDVAIWSFLLYLYSSIENGSINTFAESWVMEHSKPSVVTKKVSQIVSLIDLKNPRNSYPKILILLCIVSFQTYARCASQFKSFEFLFEPNSEGVYDKCELDLAYQLVSESLKLVRDYLESANLTKSSVGLAEKEWDGLPHSVSNKNFVTAFYKICVDWIDLICETSTKNNEQIAWLTSIMFKSFNSDHLRLLFKSESDCGTIGNAPTSSYFTLQNITKNLLLSPRTFEIRSLKSKFIHYNSLYICNSLAILFLDKSLKNSRFCDIFESLSNSLTSIKSFTEHQIGDRNEYSENMNTAVIKYDPSEILMGLLEINFESNDNEALGAFISKPPVSNILMSSIKLISSQIDLWSQLPNGYSEEPYSWTPLLISILLEKISTLSGYALSDPNLISICAVGINRSRKWIQMCLSNASNKSVYESILINNKMWLKQLISSSSDLSRLEVYPKALLVQDGDISSSKILSTIIRAKVNFDTKNSNPISDDVLVFVFSLLFESLNAKGSFDNYNSALLARSIFDFSDSILNLTTKYKSIMEKSDQAQPQESVIFTLLEYKSFFEKNMQIISLPMTLNESYSSDFSKLSEVPQRLVLLSGIERCIVLLSSLLGMLSSKQPSRIYHVKEFDDLLKSWLIISSTKLSENMKLDENSGYWTRLNMDLAVIISQRRKLDQQINLIISRDINGLINELDSDAASKTEQKEIDNGILIDKNFAYFVQILMSAYLSSDKIAGFSLTRNEFFGKDTNTISPNDCNISLKTLNLFSKDSKKVDSNDTFDGFIIPSMQYFVNFSVGSFIETLTKSEVEYILNSVLSSLNRIDNTLSFDETNKTGVYDLRLSSAKLVSLLVVLDQILYHANIVHASIIKRKLSSIMTTFLYIANNSIVFFSESIKVVEIIERFLTTDSLNGTRVSLSPNDVSIILDIVFVLITKPQFMNVDSGNKNGNGDDYSQEKAESLFLGCVNLLSNCFKSYPDHVLKCIPSVITLVRSLMHAFVNSSDKKLKNKSKKPLNKHNITCEMMNLFNFSALSKKCASNYCRLIEQLVGLRVGKSISSNNTNYNSKSKSNKKGSAGTGGNVVILSKYTPLILAEYLMIMGGGLVELNKPSNRQVSFNTVLNISIPEIDMQEDDELMDLEDYNHINNSNHIYNLNVSKESSNRNFIYSMCNANSPPTYVGLQWRPMGIYLDYEFKDSLVSCNARLNRFDSKECIDGTESISEFGIINNNTEAEPNSYSLQNTKSLKSKSGEKKGNNQLYGIISDPEIRNELSPALYSIIDKMSEQERESLMQSFGTHNSFNFSTDKKGFSAENGGSYFDAVCLFKESKNASINGKGDGINFMVPGNWGGAKEIFKALYSDYNNYYKFKGSF
ncbi:hypothetical protein AYI69_g6457 [Smittium culicis]|uniref:Nucleolar 27S pre-rRNA processing Urb2/Npa2 C-terminal domain-containing protein n=1 Tax=Smittium culicis TaxID=133412 RepID=A0A1R1XZ47_9FUNG|nr:hypothetical protein AYI69_g7808 [Smittium culicis]OMJ19839.1 hypothetical protein AYI69_g6457 [Smittium culicis]